MHHKMQALAQIRRRMRASISLQRRPRLSDAHAENSNANIEFQNRWTVYVRCKNMTSGGCLSFPHACIACALECSKTAAARGVASCSIMLVLAATPFSRRDVNVGSEGQAARELANGFGCLRRVVGHSTRDEALLQEPPLACSREVDEAPQIHPLYL